MSSKQLISINNKNDRIVVLVDMDCFYCQVEEKLNPDIRGKPIAVVQYNPWQGGGIIAVNYQARAKGVTRHMRGDEAKQLCPDIILPQVPQVRDRADISKYRDAGKEVAIVLQTFTPLLERASVDEAYLDITERVLARLREMHEGNYQLLPDKLDTTFAVGYDSIGKFVQNISGDLNGRVSSQSEDDREAYRKSDIKLLIGASIVNEIREAVKQKTGYECSAGIAHNKILAKLTAGFNKPNKQTILPLRSISKMYETLSLKKVKGLGGKLGDQVCELLKIQTMSELAKFSEKVLQSHFDERMGSWMYLVAKGIDLEAVTPRFNPKSIGCGKKFPGMKAINGIATLKHWLGELANVIQEKLEKDLEENNRTARQMTVSYTQQFGQNDVSSTRSVSLVAYNADRIAADALELIKRNTDVFLKSDSPCTLNNPIKHLSICAGKFEDNVSGKKDGLIQMFSAISNKARDGESSKVTKVHQLKLPANRQENMDLEDFQPTGELNEKATSAPQVASQQLISSESEARGDNAENVKSNRTTDLIDGEEAASMFGKNPFLEVKTVETINKQVETAKVNKSSSSNESHRLDYRQTYAEFCRPLSLPESVQKPCPECKKNVPENELRSHLDFHFALLLSQQQREKFRSEIKTKQVAPSPTTAKSKSTPCAQRSNPKPSLIEKFLTASARTTNTSTGGATAKCSECSKTIPTANMPEHLDYHAARQLQVNLNKLDIKTVQSNRSVDSKSSTSVPKGGLKRKRPSHGNEDQPTKLNTLTSYFTKM